MSSASGNARAPDPAPIFAALGDRTRLSLLMKLSDGQTRSIARLSADKSITRQAITKHLRVLETEGLVEGCRVGRERRLELRPERLAEAASSIGLDRAPARGRGGS